MDHDAWDDEPDAYEIEHGFYTRPLDWWTEPPAWTLGLAAAMVSTVLVAVFS